VAVTPNDVHIDWYAYQAGKKTGLEIGYTEGLKVGIRVIAEMKFGPPDARFLEELEEMIDRLPRLAPPAPQNGELAP
jgi:hypothetical protein